MKSLDGLGTLRGVTQLEDQIYVLSSKDNIIHIFKGETFKSVKQVLLKSFNSSIEARDIVACSKAKCIYISDRQGKCIWRLTKDGNELTDWVSFSGDGHFRKLSVALDGQLVMPHADPWRIEIFESRESKGYPVQQVMLPSDIDKAQSVLKISKNTFLVCHGMDAIDCHRVCKIEVESKNQGHMCRSYGGKKGRLNMQMDFPSQITVDQFGYVYVADCHNDRVLLLDEKLTLCSTLLTRDENDMKKPCRISYDCQLNRLIVETERGQVNVYQCRHLHSEIIASQSLNKNLMQTNLGSTP